MDSDSLFEVLTRFRWASNASMFVWTERDIAVLLGDGFQCSVRWDVSWDARGRRQRGGGVLFLDREPDLMPVHGHVAGRVDAEADARPGDLQHRDGDLVAEADALAGSSGDDEHAYTPVAATGAAGVAGRTSDSGTRANSGSRTPWPPTSLITWRPRRLSPWMTIGPRRLIVKSPSWSAARTTQKISACSGDSSCSVAASSSESLTS